MLIVFSDLHNENRLHDSQSVEKIKNALDRHNHNPHYLIIAGDISDKGKKSPNSIDFIQKIQEKLKIGKEKTFICPGNHDISCEHRDFFHEYLPDLGRVCSSENILFDKNASYSNIEDDKLSILLVNSSYKLNRDMGNVDIQELRNALDKCSMNRKVVIMHHHLIPEEKTTSHVSNASSFLELIIEKNVNLVIHGHTHARKQFKIDGCQICGIGTMSSNLEISNNYQFGFFDNDLRPYVYRYFPDGNGRETGFWQYIDQENVIVR